ncbi:MAG: hypothetical protein HC902_06410 [Calothrix sp. SM1_5_4]|nr:hypothetical protein [Calothrix sp. SM1_5_4]
MNKEEFYHVGQALMVQDPETFADPDKMRENMDRLFISSSAPKLNLKSLGLDGHPDLLELDVYAKLVEILGAERLPKEYADYYPIRKFIRAPAQYQAGDILRPNASTAILIETPKD